MPYGVVAFESLYKINILSLAESEGLRQK